MTSSSISLTLPLVDAQRSRKAGGKAVNLSKLIAARFAVPRGFVISADAYRSHLWASGARVAASAAEEAENREKVRDAILAQDIPEDIWTAVSEAYQRLSWQVGYSDPKVAVRSSSVEGDGACFGGAYESYLNVSGPDALQAAVKRVWASLWTGKAAAFRTRRGVSHEPAMAVIVQQMIDAPWSGSALTADPVTGNPHQVLVSCAARTESQEINQYRVNLGDLSLQKCGGADGGLDEQVVSLVAERAVLVENSLESRVQVEWAWDGEMLWILQADQLTDLPCYFPAEGEEELSGWRRETLHSISPLARSIGWESPRNVSEPYPSRRGIEQARLINGRVYRYMPSLAEERSWTRDVAAAQRLQAQWEREVRPDLRTQSTEITAIDLPALDDSKLRRTLLQAVEMVRQAADWLDWAEYPSLRFPQLLQAMLKPRLEDSSLFYRLLGGLPDETVTRDARLSELGERFAAAEAQDKLDDEKWWREYKADVERFAREYGYSFTCRRERYDIAVWESWAENSDSVFRMISAMTRQSSDQRILARHASAEQDARKAAAESRKMFRGSEKREFESLLRLSRDWLALRNSIEHCHALTCSVLKRVLREVSSRVIKRGGCAEAADIYSLTIDELSGLLQKNGGVDIGGVRGILAQRKHEMWLESRLGAPEALGVPENDAAPRIHAGTGKAAGRARSARTLTQASEIELGEVLVVEEPALAWTPFLAVAGGLVAENDVDAPGVAAVAREYGVPAAFGCAGALDSAERGRRAELDADEGAAVFRG